MPSNFDLAVEKYLARQDVIDTLNAVLGGGAVQTAEITLTDAQIKASPLAPLELFPPLGVDQAYFIFGGHAISHIVTPYTNITNYVELTIGWDDDNNDAIGAIFYDVAGSAPVMFQESRFAPIVPIASPGVGGAGFIQTYQPIPIAQVMNKNLALYSDNGADGVLTGGDPENTLKIVIAYMIASP